MNFEQFKAKAADTLNTVAGAASRAADSAKTGINVYSEEEKIKAAYQAIGKLYVADKKAGKPTAGPAYEEQMIRVAASLKRIEELRAQKDVTPNSGSKKDVDPADFAD